MHPLVKSSLAIVVVSTVVIIYMAYSGAAREEAWAHLAEARSQGMTVEALETARADAAGTDAEPWIAYHLAMQLWEEGDDGKLSKAREVASQSVADFPDHPTTPYLVDLVAALDTYK